MSVLRPELALVTEYCLSHLQLWFWFVAAISNHYADLLQRLDAVYLADYLETVKAAQVLADELQSEFNRLLTEAQSA